MGNPSKMLKFDNLFLFKNESASGIHDVFRELEVTTYHLNNNPHMHDQLVIYPRKQRELHSDPRRHMSILAHGPEKNTSNIENTYYVMTRRWF